MNRLQDRWNRDLTADEIVREKDNFFVFEKPFKNPAMNRPKHFSQNYEGDERTFIDEDGDEVVSSYWFSLLARNSSCIDSWVVMNCLAKGKKSFKNYIIC